jgi:hypothetical protein
MNADDAFKKFSFELVDRRTAAKCIRKLLEMPCSEKWLQMLERTDCGPPFAYDSSNSWYEVRSLFLWVVAPPTSRSYEAAERIKFKSNFLQRSKEPEVHRVFNEGHDIN